MSFKVSDKGFFLVHVGDILFFMDQSFLENTFIPKLKEKFKMVVIYVTRSGGSFDFLKKTFEMERDYKKITIHPETKHVRQVYDTYTKHNSGKAAQLYTMPCHQPLFAAAHTRELDEVKSGAYRSTVGAILYISHDRGDMQFSAKTLAAYLQRPTAHACSMLGTVVGYLKFTEGYPMAMHETSPGLSLFARLGGSDAETNKLLVVSHLVMQIGQQRVHHVVYITLEETWYTPHPGVRKQSLCPQQRVNGMLLFRQRLMLFTFVISCSFFLVNHLNKFFV